MGEASGVDKMACKPWAGSNGWVEFNGRAERTAHDKNASRNDAAGGREHVGRDNNPEKDDRRGRENSSSSEF